MSDHPREAQRHLEELEELNICDDIWLDTLALIGRVEVGTKFALISARFDAIVAIHLRHRKWMLGTLYIQRARSGTG
uniref:Ribonuclease toxin, BrnT, of type II toxin-antitoxin system n=1 Tax=Globodera pallida TaxID=36090 RepID=A0A183CK53_GLOPA